VSSFALQPHQRLTLLRREFAVIDGFLTDKNFAFLQRGLSRLEFRTVGSDYIPGGAAWSLEDQRPMESRPYQSTMPRGNADPITVAMGLFIDAMEGLSDVVGDVCGLSPEGAKTYSVRSYLYPQAVSLNWHSDARKGGAFTFYYHERWHRKWGGELLVASPELHPAAGAEERSDGDLPEPSEDDDGYMLRPLSNRLVIVRAGAAHKIAPVSRAAGSHVRRSLTGFFGTENKTS
jgi:hypothetical protein